MSIVKAHTSIIGDTGYNCHSRNFFKELDNLIQVQVRNYTVGSSWVGYDGDEPHNGEYYIDDQLKKMLVEQTLHTPNGMESFSLYRRYLNHGTPNVHIVLNDNLHRYFDERYDGVTIAYNVWETTKQPDSFFEKLKKFDQVWVPTEWQRQCTIEQGISPEKVKVVPEGVDVNTYKPSSRVISNPIDRPFRFLLVGRWDYRKSIREIIETFTKTFSEDDDVELVINVDNSFANDGMKTTEERLERYGIHHSKIRVVHHLSKEEYVQLIQSSDVFLSCARGEGWNLPLIESMACGIPSIYSNWGGQLEFARGRGIPVKIKGEVPASISDGDGTWLNDAPGNFAEPDFDDLSVKMIEVRNNFKFYKKKALEESDEIRNEFTWRNAAITAKTLIDELVNQKMGTHQTDDFAYVTCGDIGYMPLIETMVQSLLEFSTRKVIVYGINCEVPFDYPNLIKRRIDPPYHSKHDKWYWKQQSCIQSLSEGFQNYIWIDGDVVANHNIDTLSNHFNEITNYPIPDVHIQEEFFGQYEEPNGEISNQFFNQRLLERFGFGKRYPIAHACLYIYNAQCKWWFDEIIQIYKDIPLVEYNKFLLWNDEGIDNFLRAKHGCDKYLPLSKLDVSGYVFENRNHEDSPKNHFLTFWNERGPKNFNKIYGWSYIPKDKETIRYFHGNKDIEFAKFMIEFIKMQRDNSFYDTQWFYTDRSEIKNLGEIAGVEGSTLSIASKWGWDYAIYHEVYNLKDYERFGNVGVKKGDVVVDLGGNIGIFTRYAHQCGASKIITFEPDRRYFQVLKKNAPNRTVLFNAAIGDEMGTMQLTESEHLGGSNLWTPKNTQYTQYDVQTYTLDYLFKTNLVDRIDFLKVDIEGSEIIAMKGISDNNLRKVRNIVVEYHHEHLKFDDKLREQFVNRLMRLGFNSHVLFCGTNNALQLIYFWR